MQARFVFKQAERRAALNRAVLALVTDEQHAGILTVGKIKERIHCADADEARLVDQDERSADLLLELRVGEQRGDRVGVVKALGSEHSAARARGGRESVDGHARRLGGLADFLHGGGLARAGGPADDGDAVAGVQDVPHGVLLLVVEPFAVKGDFVSRAWAARAASLPREREHAGLLFEGLLRGHKLLTITLGVDEILQARQLFDRLAAGPADALLQRLGQQRALGQDAGPLEDVLHDARDGFLRGGVVLGDRTAADAARECLQTLGLGVGQA